MLGLIAALIGVGLATVGVFLFFSNRLIGNRGLRSELLAVALLLGGGGTLLAAFTLDFDAQLGPSTANFDPNTLIEQQPTAAAPPKQPDLASTAPESRLPHLKATVLAWGTPSDMDSAEANEVEGYSLKLERMAAELLRDFAPAALIETRMLTREEYAKLSELGLRESGWCDNQEGGLLLAIGVGALKFNNGDYALWREPVYEVLDCRSEKSARQIGRINEKAGDRFPYQLALRDDLTSLLNRFGSRQ